MEIVFIIIMIVVFVISIKLGNAGSKNKNLNKARKIIDDANTSKNTYADDKYQRTKQYYDEYYEMHKYKTIDGIDNYIKEKRERDDSYWGRHTVEYKVLMDLTREQIAKTKTLMGEKADSDIYYPYGKNDNINSEKNKNTTPEAKIKKNADDVFCDEKKDVTDYSYLTPSEARREYRQRKEAGEWLEKEEYKGYMDAINQGKNEDYMAKLEQMTPEQVELWFKKKRSSDSWIPTEVMEYIIKVLKEYHEDYLLNEMDKVTPGRIESWVNARKNQYYYFSETAYDKAKKIYNGEIDIRKKKSKK